MKGRKKNESEEEKESSGKAEEVANGENGHLEEAASE